MIKGEIKILELDKVSLGYNKVIYSEIEATAEQGEMIAVVGANGMGKSTLLRSISGILRYHKGAIYILGKRIENYSPSHLAQQVTFVPSQSPRARDLSLFDMVATGCYNRSNWLGNISKEDRSLILETLVKVGLKGFEKRDSSKLSDGEFQRAAIARSLVQESRVILLDEPTAFLDIANKIIITKLLKEIALKEKRTIIFSTHDLMQALNLCDKIWVMGHTRFFEGKPSELIEKGVFDQMFKDSSLKFDSKLVTFI
ncbi:MAG: ABC transporter ATP-binding protein [Bacteroidetes bacterium HGW-Bacteroidetes-8]|jgi:iron complex transport system ATP-binding protein|nr:MAG: ABC transporter ATP-binding protein [Bacteroidetes bacterium HGW-Bacteroidetes-8]